MTRAQALMVAEGATVVSKHTEPPQKPLTVTATWANADKSIVRFRIKELHERWIDSEGLDLPPANHRWDRGRMGWVKNSRGSKASKGGARP